MPTGLYPLRQLNFGFETTPGTIVAATAKAVGKAGIKPLIERDEEAYPRGVRVQVDEFLDVRKGFELTVETDLTFEELLWPCESGLVADGSPTGVGPYVWGPYTYTLAPTLKALSAEIVVDDGTTKHYQKKSGYLTTREFAIDIPESGPAKLSWTMFGRAEQTLASVASVTPITGRARIPAALFKAYIDPAWASLGSTQKTLSVRSANVAITTGMEPEFTLDGLADLDQTGLKYEMLKGTVTTKLLHNANAATEIGNWRTGTRRFMRLIADNGGAGAANKVVKIDLSLRLVTWEISDDGGQEVVNVTWKIVYDTTASKALEITITNGLAALP